MEVYRGDIFYVTGYKAEKESEQRQERPAIIVSNEKANKFSPVVEVVFLTSAEKARWLPTHVDVMCQIPSVALCEQITSVSKSRLGEYVRTCSDEEMQKIDEALMVSLGIDVPLLAYTPTVERVKNQEIDDLKMKLEGAERLLDEEKIKFAQEKKACHDLQVELEDARKQIFRLVGEVEGFNKEGLKQFEDICNELEAERDKYKRWFEALFEKTIG